MENCSYIKEKKKNESTIQNKVSKDAPYEIYVLYFCFISYPQENKNDYIKYSVTNLSNNGIIIKQVFLYYN